MSTYKFGRGLPTWNGVPMVGGIPITEGKYFFVDAGTGSDGNKGTSIKRPFATVSKAYSMATSNNNDVICLVGSGTHSLTEMLTVAKNRVHFVGLDGTNRSYGQGAKVSLGVTTAATDIATVLNTGVRNSFQNIKFINENTVAQGIYCFVDGGEFTVIDSCEIYKSTDLNVTGAAELVMNGDSSVVRNSVIGSNVNAIVGAIVRPCVMLTKGLVSGKVARDVTFIDCEFWRWAVNAANAFVWSTTATDVERKMEFRNCLFNTTKKSTGTPAVALGGAAAFTAGEILLTGSTAANGCTALATQTGIFSALPTYAADGGYGIQAT